MHLKRKLPWILTGKALLATGSIAMVALALVTYTATVTITFNPFFKIGLTSFSWSFTTSSGTHFMPGDTALPGAPSAGTSSSFAFLQNPSAGYIQVALATPVSTNDFQNFRIGIKTWNASVWDNSTLYTTSSFTTQIPSGIDGTVSTCGSAASCNVGFIHVATGSAQTMYLVFVSYILVGSPTDTSVTANFQYTPSLN